MANIKACMSHKNDEWGTPPDLFHKLAEVYRFDLDAAATVENHKCRSWISPERDALKISWKNDRLTPSRVFLNPPFSKLKLFCQRALEQATVGNALFVVALLPARTDTAAFHNFIYGHAQIEFLRGRLRFGGASGPAPFPSMIVLWRQPWQ